MLIFLFTFQKYSIYSQNKTLRSLKKITLLKLLENQIIRIRGVNNLFSYLHM